MKSKGHDDTTCDRKSTFAMTSYHRTLNDDTLNCFGRVISAPATLCKMRSEGQGHAQTKYGQNGDIPTHASRRFLSSF